MAKKKIARAFADDSRRTMTEPGTFSHNNVYILSLRGLASDHPSQGCASMANWASAWLSNRMPGSLVKHYFRVVSVDAVYWVQQMGLLNMTGHCVSVEGGNRTERQRGYWVSPWLTELRHCSSPAQGVPSSQAIRPELESASLTLSRQIFELHHRLFSAAYLQMVDYRVHENL